MPYKTTYVDPKTGRPYGARFYDVDTQSQGTLDGRLLSMSLSFSTTQISQCTIRVRESVGQTSGFEFERISRPPTDDSPNAARVDVRRTGKVLEMQVAASGIEPDGKTIVRTIETQSLGARRLTKNVKPEASQQTSYSDWVKRKVESLGLTYFGEDSPVVYVAGINDKEDAWAAIQRMAKQLGFIAFEASGFFMFGRPTWLCEKLPQYEVAWTPEGKVNDGLLTLPSIRRSGADGKTTLTLSLRPGIDDFIPGGGLNLRGVPGYEGRYIVTSVSFNANIKDAVTVTAETPINPVATGLPQQPPELANAQANANAALTAAGSYLFKNPGPGQYGGTRLNQEQVTNAVGIANAASTLGFAMPIAAKLAIMCALQESSLRVLNYGDKAGPDSRGLYQQRAPWGPLSVRLDVYGSTRLFLRDGPSAVAKRSPGYASATGKELGKVIQKTQISAHPEYYDKWADEADALLARILSPAAVSSTSAALTAGSVSSGVNVNTSLSAQQRGWGGPGLASTARVTGVAGVALNVNPRIVVIAQALVEGLADIRRKAGKPALSSAGAYNKRYIAGTTTWSNHSWGLAMDFNVAANPYRVNGPTDFPIPETRALANRLGFRWGYDYKNKRDAQHFEFQGTPSDADALTQRLKASR